MTLSLKKTLTSVQSLKKKIDDNSLNNELSIANTILINRRPLMINNSQILVLENA